MCLRHHLLRPSRGRVEGELPAAPERLAALRARPRAAALPEAGPAVAAIGAQYEACASFLMETIVRNRGVSIAAERLHRRGGSVPAESPISSTGEREPQARAHLEPVSSLARIPRYPALAARTAARSKKASPEEAADLQLLASTLDNAHVRAAAADVLARHAGTRGCDSVRAQAGRESATAGSAFARALDRCTAENP